VGRGLPDRVAGALHLVRALWLWIAAQASCAIGALITT
jgi:hypothetical protein